MEARTPTDALHLLELATADSLDSGRSITSRALLRPGPVPLDEGARVISAALGSGFGMYVRDDGRLFAFGRNGEAGRLGLKSEDPELVHQNPALVPVVEGQASSTIRQVACGENHTLCLTDEGRIFGFGLDDSGQVGSAAYGGRHYPRPVDMPHPAKFIACGSNHSAAIADDGTLWTWGNGRAGQLGYGSYPDWSPPRQVTLGAELTGRQPRALNVACGYDHTTVQLDYGEHESPRYRVVEFGMGDLQPVEMSEFKSDERPLRALAAGRGYSVYVSQDGIAFSRGTGKLGQLGLGTGRSRRHPAVIEELLPYRIVAATAGHTGALLSSDCGKVFSTGNGFQVPRTVRLPDSDERARPLSFPATVFSIKVGVPVIGLHLMSQIEPHSLFAIRLRDAAKRIRCLQTESDVVHKCDASRFVWLPAACSCTSRGISNTDCPEQAHGTCYFRIETAVVPEWDKERKQRLQKSTAKLPCSTVRHLIVYLYSDVLPQLDSAEDYHRLGAIAHAVDLPELHELVQDRLVATKRYQAYQASDEDVGAEDNGAAVCPICFEALDSPDENTTTGVAVTLSCDHAFHRRCMNGWLRVRQTCPVCISQVTERDRAALEEPARAMQTAIGRDKALYDRLAWHKDQSRELVKVVLKVDKDRGAGSSTTRPETVTLELDRFLLSIHSPTLGAAIEPGRTEPVEVLVPHPDQIHSPLRDVVREFIHRGPHGECAAILKRLNLWQVLQTLELAYTLDLTILSDVLQSHIIRTWPLPGSVDFRTTLRVADRVSAPRLRAAVTSYVDQRCLKTLDASHRRAGKAYLSRVPTLCPTSASTEDVIKKYNRAVTEANVAEPNTPNRRGIGWMRRTS